MSNPDYTPNQPEAKITYGVRYNPAIREHEVIVAGQVVNYATHESTAYHQFTEACRARREHLRNNPMETN